MTTSLHTVSAEHAINLSELRATVSHVRRIVTDLDGNELRQLPLDGKALKGLLFVQMYAVLEALFNSVTNAALEEVRHLKVQRRHARRCFHSIVLNPEFQSLVDTESRQSPKFTKRISLLNEIDATGECLPTSSMFGSKLQNVWFQTIVDIFEVLGIDPSSFGLPVRLLVDELVEKRNAISHGREKASIIGTRYTLLEIEDRVDKLSVFSQNLIATFESWIVNREFVEARFRQLYR